MSGPATSAEEQPGTLARTALRRVVLVLSVTEITSWGVLYYAFPVLAASISEDTGWSVARLAAAFSASQIVAALLGIVAGRLIDRHGPRLLMTGGSVLAVPAVLVIALAPTYAVFLGGWLLAGVAMAGVLYPPAFAALTHWGGAGRVAALTTLTLVAGLASTVFAPLTAALEGRLGWQQTYLTLAVILAVVTIPAHWFGLRARWVPAEHPGPGSSAAASPVSRTRPFLVLTLSLSLAAFTIYAVLINLVPLLLDRGLSTGQAAVALGLGGVGQVAGRLGYARLVAFLPVVARTVAVLCAVALGTALLAVLPGPTSALFAVSMLLGVARGIFTLIQATAVSDRWGAAGFGRLNGLLSAPLLTAAAVAPFAGAAIAEATGSHAQAFLVLALLCAAAAAAALGTRPARPTGEPTDHRPG